MFDIDEKVAPCKRACPNEDRQLGKPYPVGHTNPHRPDTGVIASPSHPLSLLVLYFAPRGFPPGTLVFPSPQPNI